MNASIPNRSDHKIHPALHKVMEIAQPSFAYKVRESMQRSYYLRETFKKFIPGFALNDKLTASQFARDCEIPTVRLFAYHESVTGIHFNQPGSYVLKPRTSKNAWGVQFIGVTARHELYNILTGEHLTQQQVVDRAKDEMQKRRFRDGWILEEMIPPERSDLVRPDDLKFYCFYGKVALVLHKRTNKNLSTFIWYDPTGCPVDCGKYNAWRMHGENRPQCFADGVDFATKLSAKIPLPFARVDFLVSSRGPVFGELTPHPGNFDKFNSAWDRILGFAWEEAETRLIADTQAVPINRAKNFRSGTEKTHERLSI